MSTATPYYRAQPFGARWIVTHALPGMTYLDCIDVDCLTQQAADREAQRMNAERDRRLMNERQEAALQGLW